MALNPTKLQDKTAAALWLIRDALAEIYSDHGALMNVDAVKSFAAALAAVDKLLGVVDPARREMVDEIIADTQAMHDQLHAGDFDACPRRWCVSARESRDYRASLED